MIHLDHTNETPPRSAQSGIQSVEVGAALLLVLACASGSMSLKDLAQAAQMLPAKAHRYLVSYIRTGLVIQRLETGLYDLGPAALSLGLAALNRLEPIGLARPVCAKLRDAIDQTVAIAVWANKGPTIVHWEDSSHPVTVNLRLGAVMPLLNSATGRCFAAFLPKRVTQHLIKAEIKHASRLDTSTAQQPRSLTEYEQVLAEVRERNTARVTGHLIPGVHSYCVPVFDASGRIALGLVALGYSSQFDSSWQSPILQKLQLAARSLSAQCGYKTQS